MYYLIKKDFGLKNSIKRIIYIIENKKYKRKILR
jgi:hypothetical protein